MPNFIKEIDEIAGCLLELDSDKHDATIQKKEFERIADNKDVVKKLCGTSKVSDWSEFKKVFIDYQQDHGFTWKPTPGQGGPLALEKVELPADLGNELAKIEYESGHKKGNFIKLIENTLPILMKYSSVEQKMGSDDVNETKSGLNLIDISPARTAFKEFSKDNKGFKFTPGRSSAEYQLVIQEYSYPPQKRGKAELEFGNLLEKELEKRMELDVLVHAQEGRAAEKYRNVDFEGFKIKRGVSNDEFIMYNFELKPTNSISNVSQAISQAINYCCKAHFTYIIIPMFDQHSFYDTDRLNDFIDMCKQNSLGILSVYMDVNNNSIIDVIEVLAAKRTELEKPDNLLRMIEENNYESCPLCGKIVKKTIRLSCGWLVNAGDGDENPRCMKKLMESAVLKEIQEN